MTEQLFESAQLALAAYADLLTGNTNDQRPALEQADLTSTQAQQFATRYPTVVTQFNDTLAEGGMDTGLSVTVFKDSTGRLMVAFRGVDELAPGNQSDLPTGADIVGAGAGYDQIVAMVNWWAKASTSAGQMV